MHRLLAFAYFTYCLMNRHYKQLYRKEYIMYASDSKLTIVTIVETLMIGFYTGWVVRGKIDKRKKKTTTK